MFAAILVRDQKRTSNYELKKIPPENCSRSGSTAGRKREGTSTVSLNHPLAAKF